MYVCAAVYLPHDSHDASVTSGVVHYVSLFTDLYACARAAFAFTYMGVKIPFKDPAPRRVAPEIVALRPYLRSDDAGRIGRPHNRR